MSADTTLDGIGTVSWIERRELARSITESLAEGTATEGQIAILREFAIDAKWEVRGDVANALRLLPGEVFEELEPRLVQDSNSFVRRAAQLASSTRRKSERQVARVFRAADEIDRLLTVMAQQMGESAARQARRICDRYGELIAGSMVHDLRSVVGTLAAACGNLINEGNRRRTAAVRVRECLDLSTRMLSDAESFMRALPADRLPERLAGVVSDAIQMATDNVRSNGFDIKPMEFKAEIPASTVVPMARRLLVMALTNLIKNAIESFAVSPKELRPGEIIASARSDPDGVSIQIRDNGSGMSQQELAECRRLLPGRRNKSKRFSTGYGLSIAARNIAWHGGSLDIESQESEGTCITIYLPKEPMEATL